MLIKFIPFDFNIDHHCIFGATLLQKSWYWWNASHFLLKTFNGFDTVKNGRLLTRHWNRIPFTNSCVHRRFFGRICVGHTFSFLCFVLVLFHVCSKLPVSLDYPYLIAASSFSNLYLLIHNYSTVDNHTYHYRFICFFLSFWGSYSFFKLGPITRDYYMFRFMVCNASFNNISVISWRSVLLVDKTELPGENLRPAVSHWQFVSHCIEYNSLEFTMLVVIGTDYIKSCKSNYHTITTTTALNIL
jgi:hypothetical protein